MARPSPQTDRVVTLVELLRAHPDQPLTLADVTRRLQVNKSTCHAMLTALSGAGWLLRDPVRKTYRLGPALVAVGRAAADGFPALEFAHAAMAALSVELRLHCGALAVAEDNVTVLDRIVDPRASGIPFRVGTAYPLRPPFGSAAVAWSGERAVERWLGHLPEDRRADHQAVLEATRARGYAVELLSAPAESVRQVVALLDDTLGITGAQPMQATLDRLVDVLAEQEEYLVVDVDPERTYAVNALNAPVFDHDGRVSLVISLTGFAGPLAGRDVTSLGRRLVAATTELTAALGG